MPLQSRAKRLAVVLALPLSFGFVNAGAAASAATTNSTAVARAPQLIHFAVQTYPVAGRTLNIYVGPPSCGGGTGLNVGADGDLWYTLVSPRCADNAIVRFSANNAIAAVYPSYSGYNVAGHDTAGVMGSGAVPTDYPANFRVTNLARGSSGSVWFTEAGRPRVGFIRTMGATRTLSYARISGVPNHIALGPDGTEYSDETLPDTGRSALVGITPTGQVTEYPLPHGFEPAGLAVRSDASVWAIDRDRDQLAQLVTSTAHPFFKTRGNPCYYLHGIPHCW